MAEIAAIVAVCIALAALWLANVAQRQVDTTFEEFTKHVARQVREAQNEFTERSDRLRNDISTAQRTINLLETRIRDDAEKISGLTQRISVLEHEVRTINQSLPPQFRRAVEKRIAKAE